jgi:DNA-binding winged helix-turn-helix (wHTH) protein
VDKSLPAKTLHLGEWRADHATGRLARDGEARSVEPKVMDLLFLLAAEPGRVFARGEILAALWPNVTVGEDTLARCVFKLRRALDDDRAVPRFIETIPKRGYRLIVQADDTTGRLNRRAEEFYFQFTRADNETAIALYEQALALNADDARALAGLANGLVQRAVRWLGIAPDGTPRTNLGQALACGVLSSPEARSVLARAQELAERAIAAAPEESAGLRALGLVMAAKGRFDDARRLYDRALAGDPKAWGVLINLADIDGLEGRETDAVQNLERAFAIMGECYDEDVAQIRPWYAALGCMIADRHRKAGHRDAAGGWYRRVLAHSPLHEAATAGLASVLSARGEHDAAQALCRELVARIGASESCAPFL